MQVIVNHLKFYVDNLRKKKKTITGLFLRTESLHWTREVGILGYFHYCRSPQLLLPGSIRPVGQR